MENQLNKIAPQDYHGSGEDFLKRVDYDAKTAEINKRLDSLEARIKDNDAFAATFAEAFNNSKKLDETIVVAVVNLVKTNTEVKVAIQNAVKGVDREWQNIIIKRIGIALWTLIVSVASGAIVFLIKQ